jgi:hypothetical protein
VLGHIEAPGVGFDPPGNPSAPTFGTGTETMTFAGGLTSTVFYDGFDSVTH